MGFPPAEKCEYGAYHSGSHSAKLIQKGHISRKFNPEQQTNARKQLNTMYGTDPALKNKHFTQNSTKKSEKSIFLKNAHLSRAALYKSM
jgi:hypothetical protein